MNQSSTQNPSKRHRPKVSLADRKRIALACTSCRQRKRKCRLTHGQVCQNCEKAGFQCIFEAMGTENQETMVNENSAEGVDFDEVMRQFNRKYPEVCLNQEHVVSLAELIRKYPQRPSPFPSGPSQKTSPAPTTRLSSSAFTSSAQNGMLSDESFLMAATRAITREHQPPYFEESMQCMNPFPFENLCGEDQRILLAQLLKDFPTREEADSLMATLFSHGESNWYYFDEAWFRDRIMQIYDSDLPETVADCSFTCLAFAAFALSSQFMHIWPNFQGSIGVSGEADLADEGFPGMTYFQNAQRLMPSLLSTCSLESLQSCLLTALYVLPAHSTKMAYTYLGLAMRIGIALGLHSKTADVLSPVIVENNCRVFWTTYSIERRLSISLGYPEMLQEREISCPLPQRRNDLDAPDSLKVERLIAHTKLLLLFNEVIQVRLADGDAPRVNSIRERLLLWKEDLPPALQAFDQDCLRANVHLQLQYHIVWVCLGRAALLQLVRRSIMSKETETNKNPVESTPLGLDLTYPCVRSAYEIIDLIGLLRRYQQLARFSHTDFRTCCCATIIVILDSILYPTVRASSKAAEAFDALQYMTFGNEHARSSLKYIESFLEIVNSALAKFHCRQPLQSTFHRSSEVRGFDSCSTSDEKNNRRDDHENSSPMAGSNLETMQEWRSEGGNPCQRAVADFDGLEFGLDNIEALLNDCPPMDLHFLGLGDFHM